MSFYLQMRIERFLVNTIKSLEDIITYWFLFLEACHIKTETITYEEKEQQLVSDCVKELREY